jgi:hypothetical protein
MDNYNIDAELYILGCRLSNFDGRHSINALEQFISAEGEFESLKGISEKDLLAEVSEALIDNLFVAVQLQKEGVRKRCLEWIENRKKGPNSEKSLNENPFLRDGEEVFNYLERKSPKKTGPQWYSAIYRFLADKALVSGVVSYQDFILKSKRLDSFSKVTDIGTIDGRKLDESNVYISALQKHYDRFLQLKGH